MHSLHKLAIAASLAALALGAGAQTPAGSTQSAGTAATTTTSTTDSATVKAAFKRVDANADGKLSRDEAAVLPAVAQKFTQLDKDSDGAISAAEFDAGVTTSPSPTAK